MASDHPQTEYRINDPEELSQQQRIKELLERRRDVLDARNQSFDAELLGDVNHAEAVSFYRSRVESLIMDLWTKFTSDPSATAKRADGAGAESGTNTEEIGRQYLDREVIDEIEIPPPDELRPTGNGGLAPGADPPDPKTVTIRGLRWFIENDGTIQVPFSAELYDPPGEKTEVREVAVPRETLDQALLKCIEFLDEIGVDADLTEGQGDAGFDYSDIIEEGPPEGDTPNVTADGTGSGEVGDE